jgi:hypothetical protein
MTLCYTCEMCRRNLKSDRGEPGANAALEAQFGAEATADQPAIICDDCMKWLVDVERICRELCRIAGDDPDKEVVESPSGKRVPLWMTLIPAARKRTKLPSPGEIRLAEVEHVPDTT